MRYAATPRRRSGTSLLASRAGTLAMLVASLALSASCTNQGTSSKPRELQRIRIGWQVAWATQGQIAMALQRTTALEVTGLQGEFRSFTYGAPLSEAALAGQLDVAFVGDQPSVNLLSRSKDWRIVARLMDFRVAIIVPPESPIHVVADLKGKTLGIPFGASTHRVALQMLKNAGLRPGSDVKILNIDITEQSDIVKSAGGKNWPSVDALASWDHHIALFEKQGLARVLREGTALGVVMMSQSFIAKHQDAATQFIAAYLLAYLYYATHENQVNTWFADATGGKLDPKLLTAVAAVEPNLRARELDAISIEIGPDHIAALQQAADFAHAQGLIKGSLRVRDFVVAQPSAQARQLVHERAFDIQPVLEGRP